MWIKSITKTRPMTTSCAPKMSLSPPQQSNSTNLMKQIKQEQQRLIIEQHNYNGSSSSGQHYQHRHHRHQVHQGPSRPQDESKVATAMREEGFMLYGDVTDDVDRQIDTMLAAGDHHRWVENLPSFDGLHTAHAEFCGTSSNANACRRPHNGIVRIISPNGNNNIIINECTRTNSQHCDDGDETNNKDHHHLQHGNNVALHQSLRDSLPAEKRASIQKSMRNLMSADASARALVIAEEDIDDENDEEDYKQQQSSVATSHPSADLRKKGNTKSAVAFSWSHPQQQHSTSDELLNITTRNNNKRKKKKGTAKSAVSSSWSSPKQYSHSMDLTNEERYDIEKWRTRFMIGFGPSVFNTGYIPKRWEKLEMGDVAEFLELDDNHNNVKNNDIMNNEDEQQSTATISSFDVLVRTENAIQSIFYPDDKEQQSVLLKRGPVLVGGEDERELIMCTNGFVLARMEMDTLVDLLLDTSTSSRNKDEDLVLEKSCERFSDIDADNSGSLDKYEILDLFESMGIPLSKDTLDRLMDRFDSDSDGSIDLYEFKAMLHHGMKEEPRQHEEESCQTKSRLPWLKKALGNKKHQKKKRGISAKKKLRKIDAAYCMSDIDKIIDVGLCYGADVFDPDCAKLTFAVYIKNMKDPLVITCSKSGQVEAWMDAFRTCIRSLKSQLPPQPVGPILGNPSQQLHLLDLDPRFNTSHSGLITGLPDPPRERRKSHDKVLDRDSWGSRIDWGDDSEHDARWSCSSSV